MFRLQSQWKNKLINLRKKDSSFHFQQCQMKIYHNIWRFSTKKTTMFNSRIDKKKLYSIKQKNQSKSQPYGFDKTKPFVSEWKRNISF